MSERGEITAGADGALLRNDGMNAVVEHGDQQLEQRGAHAAEALGEHVGAQQQHGADFRLGERIADSAGMAADQIGLELCELIGGDANVGQLAEAGVDAIDGFAGGEDFLNQGTAAGDAGEG